MHGSRRLVLALAAIASALALSAPAGAGAAATVHFTPETLATLQGQIKGGQVQAAAFNKKAHTVHITLKDGRHVIASYPSHNEPQLAAQLTAKGATVQIKKVKIKKKPAHHKLRYIAGGILVALIAVVAIVLGLNRRREGEAAGGAAAAGAAAGPATGGTASPTAGDTAVGPAGAAPETAPAAPPPPGTAGAAPPPGPASEPGSPPGA